MLETLAIAVLVVVVGVLLFLPTLAIQWWQSQNQDDGHSEERETH